MSKNFLNQFNVWTAVYAFMMNHLSIIIDIELLALHRDSTSLRRFIA